MTIGGKLFWTGFAFFVAFFIIGALITDSLLDLSDYSDKYNPWTIIGVFIACTIFSAIVMLSGVIIRIWIS